MKISLLFLIFVVISISTMGCSPVIAQRVHEDPTREIKSTKKMGETHYRYTIETVDKDNSVDIFLKLNAYDLCQEETQWLVNRTQIIERTVAINNETWHLDALWYTLSGLVLLPSLICLGTDCTVDASNPFEEDEDLTTLGWVGVGVGSAAFLAGVATDLRAIDSTDFEGEVIKETTYEDPFDCDEKPSSGSHAIIKSANGSTLTNIKTNEEGLGFVTLDYDTLLNSEIPISIFIDGKEQGEATEIVKLRTKIEQKRNIPLLIGKAQQSLDQLKFNEAREYINECMKMDMVKTNECEDFLSTIDDREGSHLITSSDEMNKQKNHAESLNLLNQCVKNLSESKSPKQSSHLDICKSKTFIAIDQLAIQMVSQSKNLYGKKDFLGAKKIIKECLSISPENKECLIMREKIEVAIEKNKPNVEISLDDYDFYYNEYSRGWIVAINPIYTVNRIKKSEVIFSKVRCRVGDRIFVDESNSGGTNVSELQKGDSVKDSLRFLFSSKPTKCELSFRLIDLSSLGSQERFLGSFCLNPKNYSDGKCESL